MVALCDTIPPGEGGRRKGPRKTLLFDIASGLTCRVPLTKLVQLDRDVYLYLATLMAATLV